MTLDCAIRPPDRIYTLQENRYRPSWSGFEPFINDEHAGIHEAVGDIRGWLGPADALKLYEMAYHCGGVMLEIGVFAGKSAVVQLRGALAACRDGRGPSPQFFGLDVSSQAIVDTQATLDALALGEFALLYRGDLRQFLYDLPITPTMVFVDGCHRYPGIWADLHALAHALPAGTPVLCHDYLGPEAGVRQAVTEWIRWGAFVPAGRFASSILLVVSGRHSVRRPRQLRPETFARLRAAVRARYESASNPSYREDVTDLARHARRELLDYYRALATCPGAGARSAATSPPLPPRSTHAAPVSG